MKSLEMAIECGDGTKLKSMTSSKGSEATANSTVQECSLNVNDLEQKAHHQVSVDDLSCATCKRILFQPIVLNCGHVYCESCIDVPEDRNFRCPICQSLHPHGLPGICLILEHFLEEQFSDLYAERRKALCKQSSGSTQAQSQHSARRSASFPINIYSTLPKVHAGVGCDFCGMFPIIGERYKCKDCVESIGFDLCEACHNNPVKIQGRFNQQHKPEHKFEIVNTSIINDRMIAEWTDDGDDDGSDATENNDGVSRAPELSGDVPEDGTNDLEDASPTYFFTVDASMDAEDADEPLSDFYQ